MKGLRQSIRAFVVAMFAALTVLFVTAAAMAHDIVPEGPMILSGTGVSAAAPCDDMDRTDEGEIGRDEDAISCMPGCAVLCQALLVEPTAVSAVAARRAMRRWEPPLALKPETVDAEDPPPRP